MATFSQSRLITLAFMICVLSTSIAEDLPDRYKESPEIGYFGRMSKVLFDANVTDTTIATDMIIRNVFGLMDMQSNIVVYDQKNKLIEDLSKNRLDAVFINSIDFLDMQHLVDMDHLYSLIYGKSAEQSVFLLVRNNDNINAISELRDKSLSIPKGHFLGKKFLEVVLMENSLPITESFFSSVNETLDTNTAIVDLYFNKTDAALVSDIAFELAAELNPQIGKSLSPIVKSEKLVPQIIAINKNVPDSILKKVDAFLVKSHKNKRIKHLLSMFRAKKFVKLNHIHINSNQKLINRHSQLLMANQ
ncbi:MAG: PhnD/SsuA/transferrin family substrate-binding protein [Candidatus Thiodiazotropha sp. (ex Monitilora ramsayi)]|nr:PhnD/SsuA/transferrin family substrate-binding protein [Candidatus Thiodiazotropha sp. (ex Monitilora ramsayi)]